MSGLMTNVQSAGFLTCTFVTGSLIHIHQKEGIALEIAVKVARVNVPYQYVLT